MFLHHTCITVQCDTCWSDLELDGVGGLHFENIADATACFGDLGWDVRPDGHARCDQCVAREACATEGCDWRGWIRCGCRGAVASHRALAMTPAAVAAGRCACETRWCERCSAYETRIPGTNGEEPPAL
ncbi:hypothetical protein GCM10027436_72490 [Actinophytocola sediminis]